mgnify:CR=1 FL=1
MIIDYISNYEKYLSLNPALKEGVEYALSIADAPAGRYDTEKFYVLVQNMDSLPMETDMFESHKNYMDVQIVLEKEEYVGWQDISKLTETVPYSEEKDVMFYDGQGIDFKIEAGMFYLAMPHDAHKPCRGIGEKYTYRKLVLKLPV